MAQPSAKLKQLANTLLMLDIKAKDLKEQQEATKAKFIKQCMEEGLFNKDTKAIGDVKTNFTPNRYFDLETALELVDETAIEESTVTVVDPGLLKQHMTPIQLEKAMKTYDIPLKVAVKPLELDQ